MSGRRAPVDLRLAARAALPVLAILVPIARSARSSLAAGNTLGYDYLMYDGAARRLMAGGPLYDLSFSAPGPNGLFDYPPTFILAILPFAATLSPAGGVARVDRAAQPRVRRRGRDPAGPPRDALGHPPARRAVLAVPLRGEAGPAGAAPVPALRDRVALGRPAVGRQACRPPSAPPPSCSRCSCSAGPSPRAASAPWPSASASSSRAPLIAAVVAGPGAWLDWTGLISRVGSNALTAPQVLSVGAIAYRAGVPLPIATARPVGERGRGRRRSRCSPGSGTRRRSRSS